VSDSLYRVPVPTTWVYNRTYLCIVTKREVGFRFIFTFPTVPKSETESGTMCLKVFLNEYGAKYFSFIEQIGGKKISFCFVQRSDPDQE
jgi:hypothetical protein